MKYDTAIVGGGIAGYTAALTAKNLKLNYIWFAESDFSEKTLKAEYVRNFPSFTGNGEAFAGALKKQRETEGVIFTPKRIDGIFRLNGGYTLTAGKETFEAETVIFATGVQTRRVAGESAFVGRGVSYCAVCDGALYKNREIAAVLSAQRFCGEVEYLASFAKTVHCFCTFDCEFQAPNIILHRSVVTGVEGGMRVERILTKEGAVDVDGVFFLLESVPPDAICGGLKTEGERVVTDRSCATNLQGLFAAGDITGRPYQYVKAAGEGCVAAYSAWEYLREGQKA